MAKVTQLKYLQKNNIIFLRQEGKSLDYIHEYTKVPFNQINIILRNIYDSENHIFIVKSLDKINKYFVFIEDSEKELYINDGYFIMNLKDFDDYELKQIYKLYGFRFE